MPSPIHSVLNFVDICFIVAMCWGMQMDVICLSRAVHVGDSFIDVLAFLVRQLELKACRLHANTVHVHSTMVALGVPLMMLMDVYERWGQVPLSCATYSQNCINVPATVLVTKVWKSRPCCLLDSGQLSWNGVILDMLWILKLKHKYSSVCAFMTFTETAFSTIVNI